MLPAMNIARRWHAQDGTVNKNIYISAGKLYISNLYLISKLVSAQKTESRSIPLLSVLIFIWENKVH